MADVETFEQHRPALFALAYRMLGDIARSEDVVQDTWIRWHNRLAQVDSPKAYLLRIATRLCLTELGSARARREESRADRLPEPLISSGSHQDRIEALDRISMAFLILLQRLRPAERAVFLLHEVFDLQHREIADMLGRSEAGCRQLLKRARQHVASEREGLKVSAQEHRELLRGFIQAASTGDLGAVARLLADDAVLIADAGPEGGTYGRVRNLPGPVRGRTRIAAFVAAVAAQGATGSSLHECEVNGEPALLLSRDGRVYAVLTVATAHQEIRGIFIHADPTRLREVLSQHLG